MDKIQRKKKDRLDITTPRTVEDLIQRYDLDNKDIYDYLDYLVDYLNSKNI